MKITLIISLIALLNLPLTAKSQTKEYNKITMSERNMKDFKFYSVGSESCECKIEVLEEKTTKKIRVTINSTITTYYVIDELKTKDGYIYDGYISNPNESYGIIIHQHEATIISPDMMMEVKLDNE